MRSDTCGFIANSSTVFHAYFDLRVRLRKIISTCALLLIAACMVPQTASAQTQWSLGFWYSGYEPLSSYNGLWGGLTHLRVDDAYPQADGSLKYGYSAPGSYTSACAAAHSNGVKCILGIADTGQGNLAGAVSGNLGTLTRNIASVVNTYGFDGVDVDWEATFPYASGPLVSFFSGLRTALGNGKTISADAFPSTASFGIASYWAAASPYLDKVMVMNYDLVVGAPISWFNSPLHADNLGNNPDGTAKSAGVDNILGFYNAAGIPKSKLMDGIPFYGWTVNGVSGPRQSGYSLGGQIRYASIAGAHNLSGANRDSSAQVPWLPVSGGYITYDDAQSVAAKVKYVKANGYGGWMIFNLFGDYLPSQNPPHPLLAAVQSAMGSSGGSAPVISSFVANPATINSGGSSTLSWTTTGATGLSITPTPGNVTGQSLATVAPAATTTYTLTASNSAGSAVKTLTLGVAGGGSGPEVRLSPPSLTFANQTVGTTSAVQYGTVTNSGAGNLIFPGSFAVTGDFAFGGSGTCRVATPYAPGASCTVGIVFTPTATGTRTGAVIISDNAPTSPQTITLTGTTPGVSAPTALIYTPAAGATFTSPAHFTVGVVARESGGCSAIQGVSIYVDGALAGGTAVMNAAACEYGRTLDDTLSVGTHTIYGIATDTAGHTATSNTISVTVH